MRDTSHSCSDPPKSIPNNSSLITRALLFLAPRLSSANFNILIAELDDLSPLLIKKQVPHAHAGNVKTLRHQIRRINEVRSAKAHIWNSERSDPPSKRSA